MTDNIPAAHVALPFIPRSPALKCIVIERHPLAGGVYFSVLAYRGGNRPPRRNWFTDRGTAFAAAFGIADEFQLPLIDLTGDPEAGQ